MLSPVSADSLTALVPSRTQRSTVYRDILTGFYNEYIAFAYLINRNRLLSAVPDHCCRFRSQFHKTLQSVSGAALGDRLQGAFRP